MNTYTFRRYCLFAIALFVNALGIALITKALLGTSPITSVTYVLSMFTPMTIGQWTIALNLLFVVLELPLMTRKELKEDLRMFLLQIPISLCFGTFIDVCMNLLFWVEPVRYISHILYLLIGCFILAAGITLEVKADIAMMAGEYFVRVISKRFHGEFGYIKLGFDISLVVIACLLSLCFMSGIYGVREGTVIAALVVGPIVHFISSYYQCFDRLKCILAKSSEQSLERSLSSDDVLFVAESKIIQELAEKESCVIIGRCADFILKHHPNVIKVFCYSDLENVRKRCVQEYGIPLEKTESEIKRINRSRIAHYEYYTGEKWGEPHHYNLMINTGEIELPVACELIKNIYQKKQKG